MRRCSLFLSLIGTLCFTLVALAGDLEIHYINVGWGGSALIRGPDGTTVLLEAGDDGKGTSTVVPYLRFIGIEPADGLDYVIAGHQHCDHVGGLDDVIHAGYDVHVKNFYNGSSRSPSCVPEWNAAAALTTAGAPVVMPVGTVINLGEGATLTCVAVNGAIIGGGSVSVSDENDLSIALLLHHGGFDFLWGDDMGGGDADEECTGRSTSQRDVESAVIGAISPGGAYALIPAGGIDVLHVNHHGSESSTSANYVNRSRPEVAVISVGAGQAGNYQHPRIDVVEHVLLATAPCVTVPPALVLQTEEGAPEGPQTSKAGYAVGNIKIQTDGLLYTVSSDGAVTEGPDETTAAGLPRTFLVDNVPSDAEPPTVDILSPSHGALVHGSVEIIVTAADNMAVSRVELLEDGTIMGSKTTAPYSWTWNTRQTPNGTCTLQARAYDTAGNIGLSPQVSVTVQNSNRRRAVGH